MIQAATSPKAMYTAVSLSERQANKEAELKMFRPRKKTDKEGPRALTEASEEDDDDDGEDDEPPRDPPKHTMWKAGTVGTAAATVGASIYSILSPSAGLSSFVAGGVAIGVSSTVAVREVYLEDIQGECLR
jgi:hypothetical protein